MIFVRSFAILAVILSGAQSVPQGMQPTPNVTTTRNQAADSTTRLADAIRRYDLAGVKAAIASGADVNAKFKDGQLPLTLECGIEIVKLLLDAGANINGETERGVTPLMASLDELRPLLDCELLLKAGANVNYRNKKGQTVLLYGAEMGIADDQFRLLLSHGANVNDQLPDGRTAVMVAARHGGNDRMIQPLIAAGADLSIRNKAGRNALEQYIADVKFEPGYYSHFDIPKMLKLLRSSK